MISSWDTPERSPSASPAQYLARTRSNLNAMRRCLVAMKSTTSFMTMTINRCLDYTKTNAGVKLVPRFDTIYLKSLLDMPIKMMRDAQSHRIITQHPLSNAICSHIITDKQWLLENLLCLLSNAVKYSLRGEVEVCVELVYEASEQYLRFAVLDGGIGLSDEAMQGLFNPFKQAQRLAGGTGLGLFSLAKRVEALGGQYGVQRRPDGQQGSLFRFAVPYRPDAESAALNSESSARSSTIISLSDDSLDPLDIDIGVPTSIGMAGNYIDLGERKYNILVVDDAPQIVRMTTMLLTRKGHTVHQAVNGAEALDRILDGYQEQEEMEDKENLPVGAPPFDVVLMDQQMPIMDGALAVRRLRAAEMKYLSELQPASAGEIEHQLSFSATLSRKLHPLAQMKPDSHSPTSLDSKEPDLEMGPNYPWPPGRAPFHQLIIAVSANSDDETIQDALQSGADEFMTKPFSYDSFTEMMERLGK